jgi:hypothetical protein
VEHAIGDHLLAFRYRFVFLNSIGHHSNVVNVSAMGLRRLQSVWRDTACLILPCSIACRIRTLVMVRPRTNETM